MTNNDAVINEYADGSAEKQYSFSVAMTKAYDTLTSDINKDALIEAEKLIEWVQKNNDLLIFPNFGSNCHVWEVKPTTEVPQVAANAEKNVARYLMDFRVDYLEERGV